MRPWEGVGVEIRLHDHTASETGKPCLPKQNLKSIDSIPFKFSQFAIRFVCQNSMACACQVGQKKGANQWNLTVLPQPFWWVWLFSPDKDIPSGVYSRVLQQQVIMAGIFMRWK